MKCTTPLEVAMHDALMHLWLHHQREGEGLGMVYIPGDEFNLAMNVLFPNLPNGHEHLANPLAEGSRE